MSILVMSWDEKTTPYKGAVIQAVIRSGISRRLSNRAAVYSMTGQVDKAIAINNAVIWLAEQAANFQATHYTPENIPGMATFTEILPDGAALHITAMYGFVIRERTPKKVKGDFYLIVVLNDEVEDALERVFEFTDKWDSLIIEAPPKKLAKLAKKKAAATR